MRRTSIRLLLASACIAGTTLGTPLHSAASSPIPITAGDPDAAYCAYGFLNGYGTFNPAEQATPQNETWAFSLSGNCATAPEGGGAALGDEAGQYQLTLLGSGYESCAAGVLSHDPSGNLTSNELGKGQISGSTPEGPISNGVFTYFKAGIHYYITGSYDVQFADGSSEAHDFWLWPDAVPLPACPYSAAPLIGHAGFVDTVPFIHN